MVMRRSESVYLTMTANPSRGGGRCRLKHLTRPKVGEFYLTQ